MPILIYLIVCPMFLFSQNFLDSIDFKKKGFYISPEELYKNNPINYTYDSISIKEIDLITNKEKIFTKKFKGSELPYFAYSDGRFIYFNSKNYKEKDFFSNTDYYIKSYRWAGYYFFEERFVSLVPGGFAGFGGAFGGFSGIDFSFNGNIMVQNMFCAFIIKKENFYCIEKQEIRRRIKRFYPEIFKIYRNSKKTVFDYIRSLKEIEQIDSNGVDKIIY